MILITERLILRDFVEADWVAVLAYQQNPLYLHYNEWTSRTAEDVREFIQIFLAHQKQDPRIKFQLAVTLKSTGQLIGNCGVRRDSVYAHEGDIGYELDPNYWGKGYATEAARAVLDFGFSEINLHRITAWCVADNLGSAHVLEKLGMRQEGRLRENHFYKGRWWDTLLYAILYDEWLAQAKDHANL
ncbi:MAG TPA: GNAT family protein [Anaerolineales bacterium]|nr:GNAT family protein [Anaerolineales bacterium]HLO31929.1 GNAT family protein [Anaerolineales bacterium]